MIAKPFYLLKKILFITKFTNKSKEKIIFITNQTSKSYFLEKILFTTNLKQSNQITKVKNPFLIATPIQTNLISFKMTFIGLIFV